jgi:two-component system chemotaxis sensor kinase CheA
MDISELPLAELQETLEREFRQVADQKGVSFSVKLEPGLPLTIATDPGRLRQVLKNLLSNSFKFTEHGEVSVTVGRPASGWSPANGNLQAGAVIALSVLDTGIGITTDMQQRIFEAFAQADGTTARQYGGTGLGLSISRELVRLLGGEIVLSSTPDQGSTFTVYLPSVPENGNGAAILPAPNAHAARPSPRLTPAVDLAGMKVLIVDDDFRNIFAMTTLLERGHLEVVPAESGKEGIAVLASTPDIQIVLVDIMMPVMDGYATMRAMRELPGRADIPIIAVTAKVGAGERQRCLDAGASGYVGKPVESGPEFLFVLAECLPAATAAAGRHP